jgi:membrane-associated phospholipid phosphatase
MSSTVRRDALVTLSAALIVLLAVAALVSPAAAGAAAPSATDPRSPVIVWDEHLTAALAGTSPPASGRVAAIVHGAVFDAVNGVVQRYEPLRVHGAARRGASAPAAAIEAGYRTLVALFPARADALAAQRDASLAALREGGRAVRDGREWGAHVAQEVLTWRAGDDASGTCTDGTRPGEWRRTSDNPAPCALPRLGETAPFGLSGIEASLEPPPPPALGSEAYAAELAEVVSYGRSGMSASDATRATALFWQPNSVISWNTVARSLVQARQLELVQQARVFALVDVAMADATITAWRAKYAAYRWRPVTANEQAAVDGNPATEPVSGFTPVFATPSHPDHPSGHASISAAATTVLARLLGDVPFTLTQAGQTRSYPSLSAAAEEVDDSRVFAGIHTRSAVEDGHVLGRDLGFVYTRELLLPR